MILVYDTETSGIPLFSEPSDDPRQPHVVDIACSLFDGTGCEVDRFDAIINPGVEIPVEVARIHGITTEIAVEYGIEPREAHERFVALRDRATLIVGHNVSFGQRMMRILGARVTGEKVDCATPTFCTMKRTTNMVRKLKANPRTHNDWKWPTLAEATQHFFGEPHADAHRARSDCDAAARIFFHLHEQGLIQ